MAEHHFTLVLAPDSGLEDGRAVEALAEAGAMDSTVGRGPDGVWTAVFDREAPSFKEALASAIAAVREAGLAVRRVEPDDLATQAEIAERLGRSSESVRLLASGQRGDGTFPQPVVRTTSRGSLWRWSQVAAWAEQPVEEVERAEWIAMVNARLQMGLFDTPKERAMLREVAGMLGGKRS
jgi:predicted DNA-binding transcriptional regulator AlpA